MHLSGTMESPRKPAFRTTWSVSMPTFPTHPDPIMVHIMRAGVVLRAILLV